MRKPPVGILLAAGRSERMGEAKALLELRGETFVARGARVLREGGCSRVVVVANPDTEATVAGDFEVVVNPRPEEGMLSSIRLAAARLDAQDTAIISLVDTPEIEPWWIVRLVRSARETDEILIPRFADGDGHPVLLTALGLTRVQEDLPRGLKSLIETAGPRARRVAFGGLRPLDCDTPEAYADLRIRHARAPISPPAPRPLAATALSFGLLLFASAATGILRDEPLYSLGDTRIYLFLWIAALAGGLRGVFDDLPGPLDLMPLSLLFLLLGAGRLRPYSGVSAYLLEALFAGFLLAGYEMALAVGRMLRSPSGRTRDEGSADVDRAILGAWWIGLVPPFAASIYYVDALDATVPRALAVIFTVPPFLFLGGTGLLLSVVAGRWRGRTRR